jgi:formate hydrogenlyase subunit 3/multisubunit Na+/H+ antiporter MnhD subunit
MAHISIIGWLGLFLTLASEIAALLMIRDLKRMLMASCLAEIGYVLMGIGAGSLIGYTGAVMHLGYQVVMRLLVITAAAQLIRRTGSSKLDDLVGSSERYPFTSLMFGFGMFSVMGVSPFKGAFSKFIILYADIENGAWLLALGGTIASMISAVYFIRAVQAICLQRQSHGILQDRPVSFFALTAADIPMAVLALVTIGLSLFPEPFLHAAAHVAGMVNLADLPEFETGWSAQVLVPYLGGFLLFVLGRFSKRLRSIGAVAIAAATFALVATTLRAGDVGDYFALIFSGIGLAVTVYSIRYMAHSHAVNRYYFFLFVMIGSLIGVATADHLGNFYLFWELMTWSSYLLVIHEQTDKALKAGKTYFLICASGAYVMHLGILMLHAQLGTFELSEIAARISELTPVMGGLIAICFLVGLGAKAGLFPLHSWLPEAHPVAPSSISGPMSGILTKAGILGIVKILFVAFGGAAFLHRQVFAGMTAPGMVLITLGAITFLIGEIQAYRQVDLKRMLAYSTLAQIGEITMVIGVGTYLALAGALTHIANHAIMKTLLFFCAGALIMRAAGHAQTLSALKGIGRKMPFTAFCMGIGLLSIMSVPPFSGFVSKFMMIYASVEAGLYPVAIVMLIGGVIGAMYYARILKVVFFEPYSGPEISEAPWPMRCVVGVLAALTLFNGFYPDALLHLVMPVVDRLADAGHLTAGALPPVTMQWSSAAAIAAIGAVLVYVLGRGHAVRAGVLSVVVMIAAFAAVLWQASRYDALSFWYAVAIVAMGAINLCYSIGYMAHGRAQNRFFFYFIAMIAGLLGVTASGNLFSFFAFWELMSSWTLFLVISHDETEEALREGTKYFVFNFAGASILFLGVTMLATVAGTFQIADLAAAVSTVPPMDLMIPTGLILIGFLMKAAQLPLRIDYQMHTVPAPTPVSGYISAVLLKVGPYGVLKFFVALGAGAAFIRMAQTSVWMPTLMQVTQVIAAITVLYAGAMAVVQSGIKRLLIYSTVSQLGYILLALSLGSPLGIAAGLMHAVNHMLLKNALFLVAGCILAQAHVTSLDELGGLGRKMPVTFGVFLFAGLSLAGIPPLNGFGSKLLIYEAAFGGGHYILALSALMSSLFTLAAILKFAHTAFMGQLSERSAKMHEAPAVMLVPMLLLVAASVVVGLFPGLLLVPIANLQAALGLQPIEASWLGGLPGVSSYNPLVMTIALVATAAIGWLYYRLSGSRQVTSYVHTGGGVMIPNARMHMPASALYETPERLIRLALRDKPATENPKTESPVIESHAHDH